jgi:putative transposase
MDWHSRKILAWRISNTLEPTFCVEALQEALNRHGAPEIFNTDQGAQFTSTAFTQVLKDKQVKISMDGRGRCQDNIFIERLWWTIKNEVPHFGIKEHTAVDAKHGFILAAVDPEGWTA